mmetsp:Transcript_12865/g.32945  ORF Transcript_12865/g.32945 Transcript_12865/m.32945 type:complete len:205 (+) Transcript_12865:86-700(+)
MGRGSPDQLRRRGVGPAAQPHHVVELAVVGEGGVAAHHLGAGFDLGQADRGLLAARLEKGVEDVVRIARFAARQQPGPGVAQPSEPLVVLGRDLLQVDRPKGAGRGVRGFPRQAGQSRRAAEPEIGRPGRSCPDRRELALLGLEQGLLLRVKGVGGRRRLRVHREHAAARRAVLGAEVGVLEPREGRERIGVDRRCGRAAAARC